MPGPVLGQTRGCGRATQLVWNTFFVIGSPRAIRYNQTIKKNIYIRIDSKDHTWTVQ
jgi:hypothetical protein